MIKKYSTTALKFIGVYSLGTLFWAAILRFYPRSSPPMMDQFSESILKSRGLMLPAILLFAFFLTLHLVLSFRKLDPKTTGTPLQKGVKFGASFAAVWILGFVEYHQFFGGTIWTGAWAGLGDGLALAIFGALIGFFFANLGETNPRSRKTLSGASLDFLAFAILFTAGRCIFYGCLNTTQARPIDSLGLLCEALLGVGIGLFLSYYQGTFQGQGGRNLTQGLKVVWGFFGVNWALFNLYPALVRAIPLTMIIELIGMDLISLSLALWLTEAKFLRKLAKR